MVLRRGLHRGYWNYKKAISGAAMSDICNPGIIDWGNPDALRARCGPAPYEGCATGPAIRSVTATRGFNHTGRIRHDVKQAMRGRAELSPREKPPKSSPIPEYPHTHLPQTSPLIENREVHVAKRTGDAGSCTSTHDVRITTHDSPRTIHCAGLWTRFTLITQRPRRLTQTFWRR